MSGPRWLLLTSCLLTSTGCVKSMLINGQISGTREASVAFDTIEDWDLAYRAASAGLVQFEGMRVLAPDNEDAMFMLTKAWVGYGFAFCEDEMEQAEDAGDRELAAYHKDRARKAYDRALKNGLELLERSNKGFDAAKKDEASLKKWLAKFDRDDAGALFWTGYGWMSRTNLLKEDAEAVANLWVGFGMVQRSVELDPDYNNSTGQLVIAAYHSRAAMAEVEQAKGEFEALLVKTERKSLPVQLQYATKYACVRADGAMYDQLLNEILAAEESPPQLRLMNTIAKRRAKRWLGEQRKFDACGIEAASEPEATPEG